MTRVCVITSSRADYGLLRLLLAGIDKSNVLELQVLVTGAHLAPDFGATVSEIVNDGFQIDRTVEMLLSSDSVVGTTKSMGVELIGLADALDALRPSLLVLLGDRYEVFTAAAAATMARIPIAHIHGGETTEGAIDDAMRHSITKMSHLHFVATDTYGQRVVQLGEDPSRVFVVGGLGVDTIRRMTLTPQEELAEALNFNFLSRNLVVTFHPETLAEKDGAGQLGELLTVLGGMRETGLIFTMPNADSSGRKFRTMVRDFCEKNANAKAFESLGQQTYLSLLACVDGVVGNSSSGLMEAPSFLKGTVNIGERQHGRLKATSVIDCHPTATSIQNAINKLFSDTFKDRILQTRNPYGDGGATDRILATLEATNMSGLLKKRFWDLQRAQPLPTP